jgi:hypothetical protein
MSAQNARVCQMEHELRLWWRVSLEANLLAHTDPDSPLLNDYRDEAEVIALYSTWPKLKDVIEYRTSVHDDVLERIKAKGLRIVASTAMICGSAGEVIACVC